MEDWGCFDLTDLAKATEWPKWYSNASDLQIADGAKTELEADVEFTWKTFGFPIQKHHP
jgi:hypothetical protein